MADQPTLSNSVSNLSSMQGTPKIAQNTVPNDPGEFSKFLLVLELEIETLGYRLNGLVKATDPQTGITVYIKKGRAFMNMEGVLFTAGYLASTCGKFIVMSNFNEETILKLIREHMQSYMFNVALNSVRYEIQPRDFSAIRQIVMSFMYGNYYRALDGGEREMYTHITSEYIQRNVNENQSKSSFNPFSLFKLGNK